MYNYAMRNKGYKQHLKKSDAVEWKLAMSCCIKSIKEENKWRI